MIDSGDRADAQRRGSAGDLAESIREIVCYNQGEIIQFQFLASEYHRELKEFMRENPLPLSDASVRELYERWQRLDDFLNNTLAKVVFQNFERLDAHFRKRSEDSRPHYSLFMPCDSDGQAFIGLFRWPRDSEPSPRKLTRKIVDKNTGFSQVMNSGRHYFANDLPQKVAAGHYDNERIRQDRAMELVREGGVAALSKRWREVWIDAQGGTEQRGERCYRSTYIVPITLVNNELSDDFRSRFRIKDLNKLIFGYLCFDSVEEGFFYESDDVNVGYAVADLLSLFIVYRYVFSDLSRAFIQASQLTQHLNPSAS